MRRLIVPTLVLGAAACATLGQYGFQRPGVVLEAINVTGLGLQGGAMDLLLDVHNPNGYELRTTRIAVGIDLEDTHFGDAALTRAYVLPAGDTTRIVVPVTFTWSGIGSAARGLLARGAARYRLDGRIDLDTPIGSRGLDVGAEGTVTMRNIVGQ
jgi:LEA14-like dessication related protein